MPTTEGKKEKESREQEPQLLVLLISYFKLVGLLLGVWILGYFEFSASWVFIGLFIYMFNLRYRQKKQIQIDIAHELAKNEKQAILARMDDLPSWVVFPDKERAEWVNKIIIQMWPYIGDMVREILETSVQPKIVESLPAALKSFKFVKIDLGDIAPRIGGVKAYIETVKRDEVILDLDLIYASDADIKVSIKGLKVGIKDLQVRGTLRVAFKPLIPVSPLIGGFTVFFLTNPTVDFNLTDIANALDIPGLSDTLRSIVVEQIANFLVLPNKIPIVLSEHVDYNTLKFPPPQGVLRIHCVGAKELKAADFKMVGKGTSDPFAVLKVGAQTFTTKVIQNTLEPSWNNFFEAIIDQRSGQILEVSVFDEDPGAADYLGKCSVDVESVAEKGSLNSWMPLEEVKSGMVHMRLTWFNLSTNPAHLSESINLVKAVNDSSDDAASLHSCILMVTADSASSLPMSKKSMEEPNPYVTFTIGSHVEKTLDKPNTCDPRWEENFKFLIRDPNIQSLDVEVRDKKSNRILGTLSVLLKFLLSETNMTQDQKFHLKEAGPDSTITLMLKLRVLTTHDVFDEPPAKIIKSTENQQLDSAPPSTPGATSAAKTPPTTQSSQSESSLKASRTPPAQPVSQSVPSREPEVETITPEMDTPSVQSRAPGMTDEGLRKRTVAPEVQQSHSNQDKGDAGLGRTQVTIRYSAQRSRLVVVLHKCENLLGCDDENLSDPYAKIFLSPDKSSKKKTQTVKNTLNPVFDETFEFPASQQELSGKTLEISFRNSTGVFSKEKKRMGQVQVPLSNLDLSRASTEWYSLQPEEED